MFATVDWNASVTNGINNVPDGNTATSAAMGLIIDGENPRNTGVPPFTEHAFTSTIKPSQSTTNSIHNTSHVVFAPLDSKDASTNEEMPNLEKNAFKDTNDIYHQSDHNTTELSGEYVNKSAILDSLFTSQSFSNVTEKYTSDIGYVVNSDTFVGGKRGGMPLIENVRFIFVQTKLKTNKVRIYEKLLLAIENKLRSSIKC